MMALAFHYFQLILKIDDELCKKDYNKLIVYDRNTKSSGKSHTNADAASYIPSGSQKKRICLSEEYENY